MDALFLALTNQITDLPEEMIGIIKTTEEISC
jgi:hypothetical protein